MTSQFFLRGFCVLGTAVGIAMAQQAGQTGPPAGGGSTGGTGGGTVTSPGRPGTNIPTQPGSIPGQQTNPFPTDMPRPIFLSGKVLLSDGTAPTDQVVIERVCGARVIPEGYTDSKGRFSFEVGHNTSMFMDASVDNSSRQIGRNDPMSSRGGMNSMGNPNGSSPMNMMGCELRASLAGFRSDTVNLSTRRSMDNPDVGTIVLHRMANVEGLTISATSLNAPKDAKKAYDKGRELAKKGKLDDAAKQFDKAIELYPKYAVAWYERGRIYEEQNKLDDAKKAYGESLAADSKLMLPYERLAGMAMQTRNWQETADITDRMIRLNPVDFPQAFLFNAIANLNLQKLDQAEKSTSELLEIDKQHRFVKAEHVMAVIKAQKQDWQSAATHFRAYISNSRPGTEGVDLAQKQLAEVEKTLAAQKQN